jgi:hypothetical protein
VREREREGGVIWAGYKEFPDHLRDGGNIFPWTTEEFFPLEREREREREGERNAYIYIYILHNAPRGGRNHGQTFSIAFSIAFSVASSVAFNLAFSIAFIMHPQATKTHTNAA